MCARLLWFIIFQFVILTHSVIVPLSLAKSIHWPRTPHCVAWASTTTKSKGELRTGHFDWFPTGRRAFVMEILLTGGDLMKSCSTDRYGNWIYSLNRSMINSEGVQSLIGCKNEDISGVIIKRAQVGAGKWDWTKGHSIEIHFHHF